MHMPIPCSPYLCHYCGVLVYFLLLAVVVHAVTAYQLVKENRAARPNRNDIEKTQRAGIASLKMGLTGSILLAFIVFHLLHFTTRTIYPEYSEMLTTIGSPGLE